MIRWQIIVDLAVAAILGTLCLLAANIVRALRRLIPSIPVGDDVVTLFCQPCDGGCGPCTCIGDCGRHNCGWVFEQEHAALLDEEAEW